MAEYIEREALYENAYWHGEHPDVSNPFPDGVDAIDIKDVDDIPAADVAPVRHGLWVKRGCKWQCTNCKVLMSIDGTPKENLLNYCPNCGAKMDGGAENERM